MHVVGGEVHIRERNATHRRRGIHEDELDASKQIFRQVSHEAGTSCILDHDELVSLHQLKQKMMAETQTKKVKRQLANQAIQLDHL